MEPATKQAALDKLAKIDVMVGYPDVWRNYDGLRSRPTISTAMSRAPRVQCRLWHGRPRQAGQPQEVEHEPADVNAYNGGAKLQIVFPAGILQPRCSIPRPTMP
jgi:putative endopeptidase